MHAPAYIERISLSASDTILFSDNAFTILWMTAPGRHPALTARADCRPIGRYIARHVGRGILSSFHSGDRHEMFPEREVAIRAEPWRVRRGGRGELLLEYLSGGGTPEEYAEEDALFWK